MVPGCAVQHSVHFLVDPCWSLLKILFSTSQSCSQQLHSSRDSLLNARCATDGIGFTFSFFFFELDTLLSTSKTMASLKFFSYVHIVCYNPFHIILMVMLKLILNRFMQDGPCRSAPKGKMKKIYLQHFVCFINYMKESFVYLFFTNNFKKSKFILYK